MEFTDAFLLLCLIGCFSLIGGQIFRSLTTTSGTTETDKEPLPLRTLFQIGDFTICFHWSVLVVVVCFVIGVMYDIERFYFSYFSVFYMVNVLLTLVHELGHSLTCKIVGGKVYGVFVSYSSGRCFTDGSNSHLKSILIYTSGPLADLLVLVIALLVLPEPDSIASYAIWWTLLPWNAFGIVWNLIPRTVGDCGTDGYNILHHILNYRVPVPVEAQPAHQLQ